MKQIILFFLTAIVCSSTYSQSIVGSWKTLSNVSEDIDGSKNDIVPLQIKTWACMSNLKTVFEANGKQIMQSPPNCGPIDYNKLPSSTWKMKGNVITITNEHLPNPFGNSTNYVVEFLGENKVVFTHLYTIEEKGKLHDKKIKKISITYARII